MLFTLSILLLNLVLEIEQAYDSMPYLRFIDDMEWAFLLPVFIFLFIKNKVTAPVENKNKRWWLFIPFGFSALMGIICDLDTVAGVYTIPNFGLELIDILRQIELLLALIFIPLVLFYAYSFIKYSKNINEKKWIVILWAIISTLLFSWVIAVLVGLFYPYDFTYIMRSIALFGTFLIHWVAYIGIYKYKLAKNRDKIEQFLNPELGATSNILLINSADKEVECKEFITADNLYFQKLEILCKEHHIYTDCTLSREKVAKELGISAGYFSQIVNTITGDNFANYINNYRVEAVKKMILDSEYKNYNLLAMGLESGFTSKTTFHNAFKKATGMTPNTYRNNNK
ncbi:helix-turn-helix domain-containing protein [Flavobacterium sp. '19STA2R22 D10 B1']|uniref:helix-turn-helix domain-containing protein n=1 Tax=Flavobacterium aerium TaxID=3037261 RepID=UPI00278C295B|nr:helix-turn-helix domain-containing protein [Flavobacterium sp. '19STA2R22 D10 B1']